MKEKYSLKKIFGGLPVHPDIAQKWYKDNLKLFWLGECEEGDICSNCFTLTPNIPNSHHKECFCHSELEEYPETKHHLPKCPDCNCEDGLHIESSRELGLSRIHCSECNFYYSQNCDEETLEEDFMKRYYG